MKRQLSAGLVRDTNNINAVSFSDNVKMLPIEKVIPNTRNFYRIDDDEVELLAEDILSQGLKHNLVVKDNGDGTYTLISGHKRREAVRRLVETKGYTSLLPCFVERYKDEDEEMQALIMLNVTNRKLTGSELMTGYTELKAIFERRKNTGEVSGRIRGLIAQALDISDSQVKKIENINNNGIDEVITAVQENKISVNTADKLVTLPQDEQREIIKSDEFTEITPKNIQRSKPEKKDCGTSTTDCEQNMNSQSEDEKCGTSTTEYEQTVNSQSEDKKCGTSTTKCEQSVNKHKTFTAEVICKALSSLDYDDEEIERIMGALVLNS